MSEPHFLDTKVTIPPVRAAMIPRSSITSRLDTSAPLVLLSAGAGFGKTTLLSSWARETRSHVVWVTLDEQDHDPTRFWTYVLLALRTCLGLSFGETAFALLNSTPPSPLSTVLTSLLNDLARQEEEVTLVLDDYHLIDEPAIHQSLGFWLAHAPACLHLVLSSRLDPDLPLSRLRVRGQLVEIRDADLQLSAYESALFLTQTMGLHLGEEDVLQLWQRTEGWIAGLQLAALSLRTQTDPGAFVQHFSGSHRFILDYVQDEILGRVPLSTQRFLLQTAVLTSLHADLCQALTGEQASQQMLEGLERANLFVVPLDAERRWYRLHPLFREALLARLQASEPEQVLLLHQRAAAWYEEQQLLQEAIPHAFAAHDFAYAADLIERFVVPQSWRNAYHTLHRWLSCLPEEVLRTHPDLSLLFARAMLLTSQSESSTWQRMEDPLRLAEEGYREAGNQAGVGSVLTTRAVLTGFQGDFLRAFALARQALTLLSPEDRQWRGECLSILATEAVLFGQNAKAASLLQQALACHDASGYLPGRQFTTLMQGEVALAGGDLELAAHFFRQVLFVSPEQSNLTGDQLMDEAGGRRAHFEGLAWYSLAHLAFERNDLTEAQHTLWQGFAEGWFVLLHILTPGLLLQVRLLYAQGETEQARTFLVELETSASRPEVKREIHLCQAWLALKMGDLARAQLWAASLTEAQAPLAFARRVEETLLHARLRIAEGQPEVATCLVEPLMQEARDAGHLHTELQILVLQALACEASGNDVQACQHLLQAVTRVRREGYQRLFLEEGPPMQRLLKGLLPDVREQALASYVRHLLQAFVSAPVRTLASPEEDTLPLLHPLTPQQQRVLGLLAEGASNQDIANALVISLATAKKHVAKILSKLGAENRTQAIARARQEGQL